MGAAALPAGLWALAPRRSSSCWSCGSRAARCPSLQLQVLVTVRRCVASTSCHLLRPLPLAARRDAAARVKARPGSPAPFGAGRPWAARSAPAPLPRLRSGPRPRRRAGHAGIAPRAGPPASQPASARLNGADARWRRTRTRPAAAASRSSSAPAGERDGAEGAAPRPGLARAGGCGEPGAGRAAGRRRRLTGAGMGPPARARAPELRRGGRGQRRPRRACQRCRRGGSAAISVPHPRLGAVEVLRLLPRVRAAFAGCAVCAAREICQLETSPFVGFALC